MANLNKLLYGDGTFTLHADVLEFGVLGIQLAAQLGLGASFDTPLRVYAPQKGERVNLSNPTESFTQSELYSPGVVFAVKQAKYDTGYILTSLRFARDLFGQQGRVSAIELQLQDGVDIRQAQADIQKILGNGFTVKDRYEQQEDVFRIMEVEKLIAYLFLTFILLVASFNIIGSISMLIIDKKEDVRTLRNLGAKDNQIIRIFLFEGRMISGFGALIGIIVGITLCYLQQTYGLITLGNSSGSFVVDAYPVSVHPWDCRHRILYRIAGQLWCIMVSRKIPEQKVARLTDLHNCTFHLTKIGKNTKVYFILLTFLLDIHLQGFFYNRFLVSESVFPTLHLPATISKDAGIFSNVPVAYKNDKTICAKRFPILLQRFLNLLRMIFGHTDVRPTGFVMLKTLSGKA